MKGIRTPLILLLALVLLGILGALVYKTQSVDTMQHAAFTEHLRDLKQLDAEWNVDVLRSKIELNRNYDPVATPLVTLQKTQTSLNEQIDQLGDDTLKAPSQALEKALAQKVDLIDSFKTQNSVLRNSLRFLPTAEEQLREKIHAARTANGNAAELDAMQVAANRVLTGTLRYNVTTDPDLKTQIETDLKSLDEAKPTHAPELADQLELITNHARTILTQKTAEDEVLDQIAKVPTVTRMDELGAAFDERFNLALKNNDLWRMVLIGYSGLLLLLLAIAGWQLLKSYRRLNQANKSLAVANETLEIRVQERTQELSQALSSLKASQVQLVQAEKMASLGQMVAGVAHEINTPLAYVKNSLQVVQSRMPDVEMLVDESHHLAGLMMREDADQEEVTQQFTRFNEISSAFVETEAVHEMSGLLNDGVHGIDQISEIVTNLKNFSRLDRAKVDQFDVNAGVESTLKIAQSTVKRRSVEKHLGVIPRIECMPSQINQVLLNLINNACQATQEGTGKIIIRTTPHQHGVMIEVTDNGTGIPADIRGRIFDPFFTTKKVGEGTGLGLSIVRGIVTDHGGSIDFESRSGLGARFFVYLPSKMTTHEKPLAGTVAVARP